jgi:hypothetical protein
MPGFYPRPFLDKVVLFVNNAEGGERTKLSLIVLFVHAFPEYAHFTDIQITSAVFVYYRDIGMDTVLELDIPY